MNDLISKTEALIRIRGCYPSLPLFKKNRKAWQEKYEGYIKAYEIIQDLPTAEPKTGHWIEDAKTYYEELIKKGLGVDEYTPYFTDDIACSECLAKYSVLDNETHFFKHCPNCGAKMERSNDE